MKIPIDQLALEFVHSIAVDDTQLAELADSMREQGQLHPVIVRPANGMLQVIVGEKRVLAAQRLGWTEIEAEIREAVADDDAKILRVHENLRRFNLPWYEQVILVEQLHTIRQAQHGRAVAGRPAKEGGKSGWGIRDTATELGIAIGPLSEDINLARAVALDPSLRNIKDKKTAVKLVRFAAKRLESEASAGLPVSFGDNQVLLGDATSILSRLPDSSFDCCITDPPWLSFYDKSLTRDDRTLPVFKELYRVMKFDSMLYVIVGWDDFVYYVGFDYMNDAGAVLHKQGQLETLGFHVAKTPIIWHKLNAMSRRGVKSWEYDRDFELIIVAAKGSPALATSTRLSGIKTFPCVPPTKLIHPNEKPLNLISEIIEDSTFVGHIVIDPFAGSGVVAEACVKSNRRFIVCERDKKTYDNILRRLQISED